jgi:hypothetical protein
MFITHISEDELFEEDILIYFIVLANETPIFIKTYKRNETKHRSSHVLGHDHRSM